MYGSSESHRFLTSTSPSFGAGAGDSTSLKLSSRTAPDGKLASVHALFCGISAEGRKTREVMVGIAELLADHRQATERVRDLELLAHAHAAVQLDRLLADVAARIRDLDLRGGHGAPALARIGGRIDLRSREARHRFRLLVADVHVDDPVLQRLECADRNAELLARL